MMAVNQTHPLYDAKIQDWQLVRDAFDGEQKVKDEGQKYLPATPGQITDGIMSGNTMALANYDSYKKRAVFPDFFTMGVSTLVGILDAKEAQIDLPPDMEYLRKKAMLTGEGLNALLRKIHQEQLISGRLGAMADMPKNPVQSNPQQYIEIYEAEKIINWDNGNFNEGFDILNLVVLDESGRERYDDYQWKDVKKYRVLTLGALSENEPLGTYKQATTMPEEDGGTENLTFTAPMYKGTALQEIPFVFIGPKDISIEPDVPPLIGLARLCMQIYRAEADYRHTLFMQGQDTLVIVGGVRGTTGNDSAIRVGAGARLDIEVGGDAKYVGIGANGLPEQRMSLEADRSLAAVRTGQLLAPGKMSMESGEALKTRIAAQTATLTSVAISSAGALEQLLRKVAVWRGSDPELVKVSPNLDFTNIAMAAQDLVQMMTAKNLGFPLSYKTLHDVAKDRGMTRNDFDKEMQLIKDDPKELIQRAKDLLNPPQANNPSASAGGPTKKPATAPTTSNKPKK